MSEDDVRLGVYLRMASRCTRCALEMYRRTSGAKPRRDGPRRRSEMNKYSVTFHLPNEKGFLDFVNRIGPLVGKFEVHMSQTVDEFRPLAKPTLDQSAMSAPRGKRKSKVVEMTFDASDRRSLCPRRSAARWRARAWPNRPSRPACRSCRRAGRSSAAPTAPITSRSARRRDHLARLLRQQCRP